LTQSLGQPCEFYLCGAQIIEATLAFFEDTGWYSANYSAISFVPYGHNRGAMSALKE
jgi:hypothetical protein